jgi:hypothetical protein
VNRASAPAQLISGIEFSGMLASRQRRMKVHTPCRAVGIPLIVKGIQRGLKRTSYAGYITLSKTAIGDALRDAISALADGSRAALVVLGFIGFAFSKNRNLKPNREPDGMTPKMK